MMIRYDSEMVPYFAPSMTGRNVRWAALAFAFSSLWLYSWCSCAEAGEPSVDIDAALAPIWKGGLIRDETVLFMTGDREPEASLLLEPAAIVAVRSPDLKTTYEPGRDYTVDGRVLRLPHGSRVPFVTRAEMYPAEAEAGDAFARKGGGLLRGSMPGGKRFCEMQASVTYNSDEAGCGSYEPPPFAGHVLRRTLAKLEVKQPLAVVLYGDSIAAGAETSGFWNVAPRLPSWGELVRLALEHRYGGKVALSNPSVGGKSSDWGRDNAESLVAARTPDLVIIAFGMGDAHEVNRFSNADYKANIQSIIDTVRRANPACEFILVGTMLANPEAKGFHGEQIGYLEPLHQLASTNHGVAVADVSSLHAFMLTRKKFWDMSGNGVNHPSDFLARVYAQVIMALLAE